MKYTVVSSAEYTYPDIWEYPSAAQTIDTFSARGSYATFQVLFGEMDSSEVTVAFDGLPAGDTHIIYPGKDGPWMSIRLEAEHESAEEYELLRELAKTDKALADRICESVFRFFKDVEYDVAAFTSAKKRLLEALS